METSDNIRTNSDLSITTVRCCTVTNLFLTIFEKIGSLGFTNLASLFVVGRLFKRQYALSSNKIFFLEVSTMCRSHLFRYFCSEKLLCAGDAFRSVTANTAKIISSELLGILRWFKRYINISLPASIMTSDSVWMIKQRIVLTEIPEVKWNRYMRSHNSGNIHGENLHVWAVELKSHFSKTIIYFHKKNYTTIIRTY